MDADKQNPKPNEDKQDSTATDNASTVEQSSGQADLGGRSATARDKADEAERKSG